MEAYRLVGICGSLRQQSYNRLALELAAGAMPEGTRFAIHDISGLPFYDEDLEGNLPAGVAALAKALEASDGVVMACPEYNHSLPAVLKNAIDWLSRTPGRPLAAKPVMILSAATGPLGGARVQYELRRVLDAVEALPLVKPEVFIGMAHNKLAAGGRSTDAATIAAVTAQCNAFRQFIDRHKRISAHGPPQTRPEPAVDFYGSDAATQHDPGR